mgnify:CR=1 FL=1
MLSCRSGAFRVFILPNSGEVRRDEIEKPGKQEFRKPKPSTVRHETCGFQFQRGLPPNRCEIAGHAR